MGKKLLVGVLTAMGMVIFVLSMRQIRQHSGALYVQEDQILPSLNDGDVICRLGDRIWSHYFKEVSPNDKRFSYLGIVRIRDNVVTVINAEGLAIEGKDYVNETPLKDFLKIAQRVGLYRMRTLEGYKISDAALLYKGRSFDWHFDMEDDNALYCSELLYVILKRLDPTITLHTVWLKNFKKNIVPLDVCLQAEYFIEVGYWGKL
jgi:hypothetical protein